MASCRSGDNKVKAIRKNMMINSQALEAHLQPVQLCNIKTTTKSSTVQLERWNNSCRPYTCKWPS
eukprot:1148849-Pelagomonas_calceolata.AAC.2